MLWNATTLAKATGLSGRHIRRLIAAGTIKAQRATREWTITDEEANRFIQSRAIGQQQRQNQADDERGHQRKIKPTVLPLHHDVAGQTPQPQLRQPWPQQPRYHENDAECDEQSGHGNHQQIIEKPHVSARHQK